METIIQGSNDPLVLDIENINEAEKISAVMASYGKVKKEWSRDDMRIQDDFLILPLSEEETLEFNRGVMDLDIKALDADGKVVFMDIVHYRVIDRVNRTRLTGE